MEFLETPEARFANLPDFPFSPHYVEVDPCGLRMHYIDEGPSDGPVALLLHGEPSWSYLYRFMIPPLAAAGMRVIAPDLIGFGRSSKPTERDDYTYARHVMWMRRLLDALSLEEITLFGQDWGSLIGLRIVGESPERFRGVVIGNGFLPTGEAPKGGIKALLGGAAFLTWRAASQAMPVFPTGRLVAAASGRTLFADEVAAYDAPFPDARYQAGARAFPMLVPISPDMPGAADNRAAWKGLEAFDRPFITAFSTGDPITRGLDRKLQRRIAGASGQAHVRVPGGHFLQEVSGLALADKVLEAAGHRA